MAHEHLHAKKKSHLSSEEPSNRQWSHSTSLRARRVRITFSELFKVVRHFLKSRFDVKASDKDKVESRHPDNLCVRNTFITRGKDTRQPSWFFWRLVLFIDFSWFPPWVTILLYFSQFKSNLNQFLPFSFYNPFQVLYSVKSLLHCFTSSSSVSGEENDNCTNFRRPVETNSRVLCNILTKRGS